MKNGLRVKYENAMWITLDGQRCEIPDSATDAQLFDGESTPAGPGFGELAKGPEISSGACFVKSDSDSTVYFINNNQKRRLESVCGNFSLRNMESLRYPYILAAIPTGTPIPKES